MVALLTPLKEASIKCAPNAKRWGLLEGYEMPPPIRGWVSCLCSVPRLLEPNIGFATGMRNLLLDNKPSLVFNQFSILANDQLTKLEKQQQRKEKTRTKVPSESSRERNAPRNKDDPSASSGAEGDVSSEREP
ncbi:hypothetical protein KIL84_017635 [Mauremys mutica]|uniref:Uncharacterized protein n=1 Tax=Mauremys mutica TaxID=74926 RepID=A0A9D3X5R7_9SAUR|nr:hypothetical protein KIL84_017635 [Mauremys mutica]